MPRLQKSLQEFLCLEQGIASPSLALAVAGLGCSCKKCNQKYPCQSGLVGVGKRQGMLWVALVLEAPGTHLHAGASPKVLKFFFHFSLLLQSPSEGKLGLVHPICSRAGEGDKASPLSSVPASAGACGAGGLRGGAQSLEQGRNGGLTLLLPLWMTAAPAPAPPYTRAPKLTWPSPHHQDKKPPPNSPGRDLDLPSALCNTFSFPMNTCNGCPCCKLAPVWKPRRAEKPWICFVGATWAVRVWQSQGRLWHVQHPSNFRQIHGSEGENTLRCSQSSNI